MSNPVRVLHVFAVLKFGGSQSFLLNVYNNINRERIQFDFLTRSTNNDPNYVKMVSDMGGRVFNTLSFPGHILQNHRQIKCFFKEHGKDYSVIHVHANTLLYMKPLTLAKKYGIGTRIIHSHSTKPGSPFYTPVHVYNKHFVVNNLVTTKLACSDAAGKWMFTDDNFKVVKNAITIDKFLFRKAMREEMRRRLNIVGKFVVGHAGRFAEVKNHKFILKVFAQLRKKADNAVLMLLGSGETEEEIRKTADKLNLTDSVMFLGVVNNVHDYMQAMDVFLFPSLYEGLPFVLIEAQAAGLPCIISDTVSEEACITSLAKRMSLNTPAKEWAEELYKYKNESEKCNMTEHINRAGYNITEMVKFLEEIYIGL